MKSMTLKALTLAGFALSSTLALADEPAERFVLDLNGREYNSQQGEDTIPLKAMIRQKYGDQDLEDADLVRVAVVAKSQFGRAQLSLLVGTDLSRPEIIQGSPQEYARPGGFARYLFASPGRESAGVWQLKLQGNVKIERIAVVVRDKTKRFALDLRGQEFNSGQREDTVALKALIQRQYGNVDLRGLDLTRVTVMAKSQMGRARMSLLVGNQFSQPQLIRGNPRDYFLPGRFSTHIFASPGRDPAGVWQLKIQGNVKIDRILVEAR